MVEDFNLPPPPLAPLPFPLDGQLSIRAASSAQHAGIGAVVDDELAPAGRGERDNALSYNSRLKAVVKTTS